MRHVNNNPLIYLTSFSFSLTERELNTVEIVSLSTWLCLMLAVPECGHRCFDIFYKVPPKECNECF